MNTLCTNCKAKMPTLATRLRRVNSELHQLGLSYHDALPFPQINSTLERHGLPLMEEAIGEAVNKDSIHFNLLEDKWLHITFHRMESGRFEVVAYIN